MWVKLIKSLCFFYDVRSRYGGAIDNFFHNKFSVQVAILFYQNAVLENVKTLSFCLLLQFSSSYKFFEYFVSAIYARHFETFGAANHYSLTLKNLLPFSLNNF